MGNLWNQILSYLIVLCLVIVCYWSISFIDTNKISSINNFFYNTDIINVISKLDNSSMTGVPGLGNISGAILPFISIGALIVVLFYVFDYIKRKGSGIFSYSEEKYGYIKPITDYFPSIFLMVISGPLIFYLQFSRLYECIIIIFSIAIIYYHKTVSFTLFHEIFTNYDYLNDLMCTSNGNNNYKSISYYKFIISCINIIIDFFIPNIKNNSKSIINDFAFIKAYETIFNNILLALMLVFMVLGILYNFNLFTVAIIEVALLSWFYLFSNIFKLPQKIKLITNDNDVEISKDSIYIIGGNITQDYITVINKNNIIRIMKASDIKRYQTPNEDDVKE